MNAGLKPFTYSVVFAAVTLLLSACSGGDGIDVEVNSPLLEAVGVNIMGGKKPEPDLPERAPLVMPPRKDGTLPTPTDGTQAASANGKAWPVDPEQKKKEDSARLEALRKEYCRQGDWSKQSNIDEFRKNTGQEPRCRPEWVDKISQNR